VVATAKDRETDETSERAESSLAPIRVAKGGRLHLVPQPPPRETARGRRLRPAAEIRALAVWPRLDPRMLYRCHGEPACLGRAIARHRTTMSVEQVIRILTGAEE
jgi:hypothetical protein